MKRLLSLLLVLLLLSGCAAGGQSDGPPETPEPTEQVTEAPAPPEQEPVDLSAVAVEGAEGFYDLTALPQMAGYEIHGSMLNDRDQLLFLAGPLGQELHRLDLNTGEETCLCTIPVQDSVDWVSTSLLSVSPLAVCQSAFAQEAVYIVSDEGDMTALQAPEGMVIATWNACFTDSDCIWLDNETYQLIASPLSGGSPRTLAQIPPSYFYCGLSGLTADGSAALLTATYGRSDSILLTVSLDTGEVTGVYEQDEDGAALDALRGGVYHLSRCDDAMEVYTLTASDGERQVTALFDLHALSGEDTPLRGQDWWLAAAGQQGFWGKSLVWADCYTRGSWVLLWDYTALTPDEAEHYAPVVYTPPEPVTESALAQRVAALEERYGISIHTGEDMDAPYPDYTLEPCTDLEAADQALSVLEQAFALYPEDYFRQLGGESIRGFSFYLCGRMTPIDPSTSIDSPGGLSYQADGVELLAFDITSEVRVQDVVHELTHVLDHWLWEGDVLDEDRWAALNPEGFSYYYAYVDPEGESYEWAGDTAYTAWDDAYYEGDVNSVWFVDPYSTTYPTEDRARLMEYLLADPDYQPNYYQSIHIQAKLNYYFLCIREKFDDSAWPELTSWEAALGPVG